MLKRLYEIIMIGGFLCAVIAMLIVEYCTRFKVEPLASDVWLSVWMITVPLMLCAFGAFSARRARQKHYSRKVQQCTLPQTGGSALHLN